MSHHNRTLLREFSAGIIEPKGPFCAKTTLLKPSHFPSPFDQAEPDWYRSVTRVGCEVIGIDARVVKADAVELRLFCEFGGREIDVETIKAEIGRRLGLDMELDGYESIWNQDEILSRLPVEMLGARPSSPFSLYEFLVICVLLQNTTVKRTVAMAQALADEIGAEVEFPDGGVLHCFWMPAELATKGEARLRSLKIGYRAKILDQLSLQFLENPELENSLLESRDDDGYLKKVLGSLYGIGPASVGYVLFEWFKKVDCFDHVSPWELKILSKLLFDSDGIDSGELIRFCKDRWAPFEMLAVHAVFEAIFWQRRIGKGPEWLDALVRL